MPAPPATATSALLAGIWQRNLPTLRDRLDQLDAAASALRNGTLTDAARAEAAGTAHKLAGSLGMFGYAEATDIARRLELLFDTPAPDAAQAANLTQQLRLTLPAFD